MATLPEPRDETTLLEVEGLVKAYRGRRVVDGVSFRVGRHEIVGLLGPNGAGKSTSFRMTVGLTRPDAGAVRIMGEDCSRLPMFRRARLGMGYLPQEPSVFRRMSVRDNLLAVRLDSTERPDIPPYGGVVDYLTFGGIYRDVSLRYVEPVHIADVFVRTKNVLTDNPCVEVDVTLQNTDATDHQCFLYSVIRHAMDGIAKVERLVDVPADDSITTTLLIEKLPAVHLWSPANPLLYSLDTFLKVGEKQMDGIANYFGFREAEFRDDGFYLNGEMLKLIGLNRHQTYPYIGAAAPKRLQEKDANIVKYELGCNIVRTSHYRGDSLFRLCASGPQGEAAGPDHREARCRSHCDRGG